MHDDEEETGKKKTKISFPLNLSRKYLLRKTTSDAPRKIVSI